MWGVVCSFGGGVSWCPLVQRSAGVRGFRTCRRSARVLWWCAPRLLSALLHCACRVACKYGSISRFKGVFSGFWGADVCLYGFGALLGLCGFCARVELGGYMTCGVFCLSFSSFLLLSSLFLLSSCSCPASLLGFCSWSCPFSLCGSLLFPFPLRMYGQKKGRAVLVRPRFVGCGLLYLVAALYSSYSSGVNPFIS